MMQAAAQAGFRKVLAKYYFTWFYDCCDSAAYCRERGLEDSAKKYIEDAKIYLTIIMENWEAIEYFAIGDNAFKYDECLLPQFRGYK